MLYSRLSRVAGRTECELIDRRPSTRTSPRGSCGVCPIATDHAGSPCRVPVPTVGMNVVLPLLTAIVFSASWCDRARVDTARAHPIAGTWLVHDPNAPFPTHLCVFNRDGTMQQANPDAGDPRTSDSDRKGVWSARSRDVEARWVALMADRATHQYSGRLEVTMQISVTGDSLAASEVATLFDATRAPVPAPATPKPLRGARITLP